MPATLGGVLDPTRETTFTGGLNSTGATVLSGASTISGAVTMSGGASIVQKVTVYPDSAAITVESHVAVLTKVSASAMTLAAPSTAQNGTTITIIAGTAAAHVTTGTNLFQAGETGGPFNKVTTAAFIGSSATLVAYNGIWMVVSDQIATVGD